MSMSNTYAEWSLAKGGQVGRAGGHGKRRGDRRPYCGDLGGVSWGSLLGFFPGWCGGGDAHRPAGRRTSRGGRTVAAGLGLEVEEEEEVYVSLDLASPTRSEASGHFFSSPVGAAQASFVSFGAAACWAALASLTR